MPHKRNAIVGVTHRFRSRRSNHQLPGTGPDPSDCTAATSSGLKCSMSTDHDVAGLIAAAEVRAVYQVAARIVLGKGLLVNVVKTSE